MICTNRKQKIEKKRKADAGSAFLFSGSWFEKNEFFAADEHGFYG
jgi:hypothetical protein